jgi:type VI secretion system protein ImpE
VGKAKELLEAGQLTPAIEQVTAELKNKPADVSLRLFLFELLCFSGDLNRAEKQLDVVGHQDAKVDLGVQVYRNNIKAERDRRRLFSEGLQPHFLSEPPEYIDRHLEAINQLRQGNLGQVRELLDRAEEERPAISGQLSGESFQDFRDADDFVSPILELIVHDKYTWLPFEQLKRIEIAEPKQLRDLIWTSATLESAQGAIGEVFIPVLYAGSSDHPNNLVKLGRMTDWRKLAGDLDSAAGSRLFLIDDEDRPIFEARTIEFDSVVAQAGSGT